MSCGKMAESIEMLFEALTHVSPRRAVQILLPQEWEILER